MMTTF